MQRIGFIGGGQLARMAAYSAYRMGFEVAITLIRPGYHIKKRRIQQKKVSLSHQIKVEEARDFLTQQFGVTYGEAS